MLGIDGEVRMNSETMFFYGPQHIDTTVMADQQKLKFTSSVQTLDTVLRTYKE